MPSIGNHLNQKKIHFQESVNPLLIVIWSEKYKIGHNAFKKVIRILKKCIKNCCHIIRYTIF